MRRRESEEKRTREREKERGGGRKHRSKKESGHGRRIYEGRDDERTTREPSQRGGTRNGFENTYAVAVVEAGRSWSALIRHLMLEGGVPGAPRPARRLSLLVAPVAQPPCRAYVYLSSLSCHRPGPDASATTGRRIVIVSEIGDPADSDRHRRPPFPSSLLFFPPSPYPLGSLSFALFRSLKSPLSFVPPPPLPPFKS